MRLYKPVIATEMVSLLKVKNFHERHFFNMKTPRKKRVNWIGTNHVYIVVISTPMVIYLDFFFLLILLFHISALANNFLGCQKLLNEVFAESAPGTSFDNMSNFSTKSSSWNVSVCKTNQYWKTDKKVNSPWRTRFEGWKEILLL